MGHIGYCNQVEEDCVLLFVARIFVFEPLNSYLSVQESCSAIWMRACRDMWSGVIRVTSSAQVGAEMSIEPILKLKPICGCDTDSRCSTSLVRALYI